jgi:hypothetical protein
MPERRPEYTTPPYWLAFDRRVLLRLVRSLGVDAPKVNIRENHASSQFGDNTDRPYATLVSNSACKLVSFENHTDPCINLGPFLASLPRTVWIGVSGGGDRSKQFRNLVRWRRMFVEENVDEGNCGGEQLSFLSQLRQQLCGNCGSSDCM